MTFRTEDKTTGGGMLLMWPGRSFCMGLYSVYESLKSGKVESLGEATLTSREISRVLSISVSVGNPNFSFSVTATINDKVIVFLVDTGLALTIMHRDTWEKWKEPQQHLESK